jgi:hypothetical protein
MKTLSFVVAIFTCVLAIGGVIALLSFLVAKTWAKATLTQSLAKKAMAFVRALSALAGIFVSQFRYNDEFFYATIVIAIFAYFAWELAGFIAEEQSKVEAARLRVLERTVTRFQTLFTLLSKCIKSKRADIAEAVKDRKARGQKPSVNTVRDTLKPDLRIKDLLDKLAQGLTLDGYPNRNPLNQKFRVCVYIEDNGYVVDRFSFDTDGQTVAATKSSASPEHRHKFCLGNRTDPSVVVQSIQKQEPIIVPDCNEIPGFYFNEVQKSYLKSMVSYPFMLGIDPKKPTCAAIVLDTNVSGHFKEEDAGFLAQCLLEFSARIDLELMYNELWEP